MLLMNKFISHQEAIFFLTYYQTVLQMSIPSSIDIYIYIFFFLGPHPRHMEIPRLGVKLELQLLVCVIATAVRDPSHICDLHHSLWQRRILNPLSEARDWTHILLYTSRVCFCEPQRELPRLSFYIIMIDNFFLSLPLDYEHANFLVKPLLKMGHMKEI